MTTITKSTEKTPSSTRSQKIWICKTNISTKKALKKIALCLNEHPHIIKWSIDSFDEDKVLRVISQLIELEELISIIGEAGYSCEELPD